ncbi:MULTISPECIES: hypothetical protein [Pseudomonas]|uniref:hypothetical protein n=1 Tax=Pseudomonas TaxID=286 RepID=UPI002117DC53|nr:MULTISPECIES: hypothetical protein [Pseudomonas]MEC4022168.1 hypothetical protein [Pseudomonas fulva]
MSHQFKPGDLALIVGAHRLTENIGKTCTLQRFLQPGEFYSLPDGGQSISLSHAWLVDGDGVKGLTLNRNSGLIEPVIGSGLVDPQHLMPLRGDFAPEQQKAKEAEPCA